MLDLFAALHALAYVAVLLPPAAGVFVIVRSWARAK